MKLLEIVDPQDADVFHVHSGDDIFGALKASLMHDFIVVDIEAHPEISDQQLEADSKAIIVFCKSITKHKPKNSGSTLWTCNLDNSADLKKLLDLLNDYFKPGLWRWAASVTNWDLDT